MKISSDHRHATWMAAVFLMWAAAGPVSGATYLVWTNGSQTPPYDTWGNAFSNIQDAANYATNGDLVWVTNGVYSITNQITVTNQITIQSVSGATNTIVRRSAVGSAAPNHRIFYLATNNVVLDGLTITNGYASGASPRSDGGGVYMAGSCTLRNCTIVGNTIATANMYGGGIYSGAGGTLTNCVIAGNSAPSWAGGFWFTAGGTIQNCLLAGNSVSSYGGGAGYFAGTGGLMDSCVVTGNTSVVGGSPGNGGGSVWLANACTVRNSLFARNRGGPGGGLCFTSGGTVQNCTITDNGPAGTGGGVYFGGAGTVQNSIVYNNSAAANANYFGGSFTYSCTYPAASGTGNTNSDPLFVSSAQGNYRLLPGSPCIGTGTTNISWLAGAQDLDGNSRILPAGGIVDMGAYEFKTNNLMCNFLANVTVGLAPLSVAFTSYIAGTNLNGVGYLWDFDNNGTIDAQGADKAVVTNPYAAGNYSVTLIVTNAAGESNSYTRLAYIKAGPLTNYVSLAGTHSFPFTNWTTAATNIQAAVDAGLDGTLVLVTNGTYVVTSQVVIAQGITVKSINGQAVTTVSGNGTVGVRCFYLNHSNAVVDGFTLTNGNAQTGADGHGGGVRIVAPNLQTSGGTVRNCAIVGNSATYYGGGVYSENGGLIENCVIRGNSAAYGGAMIYGTTVLRGCLIVGNRATTYGGGGVYVGGPCIVENCTIASNSAVTSGGGIWLALSSGSYTARNDIVYFNTAPDGLNWKRDGGSIQYCCTTPDASAYGGGNFTNDPSFASFTGHNFRVRDTSPCVNQGTNVPAWMIGAVDLDGNPRIVKGQVDVGAYEYVWPPNPGLLMMLR